MTKLIVDEALRAKLHNLDQHLHVFDETGRELGHFLPAGEYRRLLYESVQPDISEEELDRRAKEPGGHTLKEIRARLANSV
jgi:hypothetical protein